MRTGSVEESVEVVGTSAENACVRTLLEDSLQEDAEEGKAVGKVGSMTWKVSLVASACGDEETRTRKRSVRKK